MSTKTLPIKATITNPRCSEQVTASSSSSSSSSAPRPTNTDFKLMVVGIDNSGKTVLFNRVTGGDIPAAYTPTFVFAVQTVAYPTPASTDSFTLWDFAGLAALRKMWYKEGQYCNDVDGVVYVVDASEGADSAKTKESVTELAALLKVPAVAKCPVLVLANKQDKALGGNVLSAADLNALLSKPESDCFASLSADRKVCVQGCSAQDGEGVRLGLDWLYTILKNTKGAGTQKATSKLMPMLAVAGIIAVTAVGVALMRN